MLRPEHDLMGDGYARGFPGDNKIIRMQNRTAHSFVYHLLNNGFNEDDIRLTCTSYQLQGCPTITNYIKFAKDSIKAGIPSEVAKSHGKKSKVEPKPSEEVVVDLSDMDF